LVKDIPVATLQCYNMETSFAEKLEAIVRLGQANSRMKDFLDLARFIRCDQMDLTILQDAVHATFSRRRTTLPDKIPIALTEAFWQDGLVRSRWAAFARKNGLTEPEDNIASICNLISQAILPLITQTPP
jgi:hypothetical protein